jgi:transcriptional regulator with XRE-family HTH domain
MSTADYNIETGGVDVTDGILPLHSTSRPLHRISEVREQQGISLRSLARKFGCSIQQVREEEAPDHDMTLSDLRRWQKVLDVPLADLLEDDEGPLSSPVGKRACLLRTMKTAKAIGEAAHSSSVKRLTNMLIAQLVELMPELEGVTAWHSVGQRRSQRELGKIAECTIPENLFNDDLR